MPYPRLQVNETLSKNKENQIQITKWGFITDNIIYGTFSTKHKYMDISHYYSHDNGMYQIVVIASKDNHSESVELQVPNEYTIESVNFVALKWEYQIYVIVSSKDNELNYNLADSLDIASYCDDTFSDEEIEKMNNR